MIRNIKALLLEIRHSIKKLLFLRLTTHLTIHLRQFGEGVLDWLFTLDFDRCCLSPTRFWFRPSFAFLSLSHQRVIQLFFVLRDWYDLICCARLSRWNRARIDQERLFIVCFNNGILTFSVWCRIQLFCANSITLKETCEVLIHTSSS